MHSSTYFSKSRRRSLPFNNLLRRLFGLGDTMKSLAKLVIAFSFLFVGSARAGLLLEPYAGYAMSTSEGTVKATSTKVETEINGLAIGGRLGYQLPMGVWFAGDYLYLLETTHKYKSPSGLSDDKAYASTLFLDVGVDLPVVPLRFWAGYGFMNNIHSKNDAGASADFDGSAIKAGVGFKAIPMLSINLEYIMHNYSKYKTSSGIDSDIGDYWNDFKASTIFFSLSAPLGGLLGK